MDEREKNLRRIIYARNLRVFRSGNMVGSFLKKETEWIICAAEHYALRTNSIKYSIDRKVDLLLALVV